MVQLGSIFEGICSFLSDTSSLAIELSSLKIHLLTASITKQGSHSIRWWHARSGVFLGKRSIQTDLGGLPSGTPLHKELYFVDNPDLPKAL